MAKINVSGDNVQEVLADLLTYYAGEAAYNRMLTDARNAHQSVNVTAKRTAGNLLRSFVTRKPSGYVLVD